MKKPNEKDKKRIRGVINILSSLFLLDDFEISYRYHDTETEYREGACVVAWCYTDLVYKRFTLNLNPSFWNEPVHEQHRYIIHELCHRITAEQRTLVTRVLNEGKHVSLEEARQANERETTTVEKIVTRLLGYPQSVARMKKDLKL